MGKICILSKEVVSKIAAGEVVQRPSDVVKELVENSIDAGATKIKIEVSNSGLDSIKVTDNGFGMERDDLEKCFLPHATSKVFSEDDLIKIASLGFRGEALNSIASVSELSIVSRIPDSIEGHQLEISGGRLDRISTYGMPKGTTVSVENIFFNVPVRKKFLKSPYIEFSEILSTVSDLAVSYPKVEFKLIHNSRVTLDLPKNQTFSERVSAVFGGTLFADLLEVEHKNPHIFVKGFISRPQVTTTNTNKQSLFVNDRSVSSSQILSSVRSAYGTLLQPRTYPVFVLKLSFAPELVDVNVHPRKEEVKFVNKKMVNEVVKDALVKALQQKDLTYIKSGYKMTNDSLLRDSAFANELKYGFTPEQGFGEIIQVHNQYLVTQTADGVVFIDQHAAHERIIFEHLQREFERKKKDVIELFKPEVFDLPGFDAHLLREQLHTFTEIGFVIEEFGGNSFRIRSVPKIFTDRNLVGLVKELLEDITDLGAIPEVDSKSERVLSYLACRSAIKSGEVLDKKTRESLIYKLSKTKTKYTCPHGRPVKVEIKMSELNRHFKRI